MIPAPLPDVDQILRSLQEIANLQQAQTLQGPGNHDHHDVQHVPQQHQLPPGPPPGVQINPEHQPILSSTITEWKYALRYVTWLATKDPTFDSSIRNLVHERERYDMEWQDGLEQLLLEQKAKREDEEDLRTGLALAGIVDETPVWRVGTLSCDSVTASTGATPLTRQTAKRDLQELRQYQAKVYEAAAQLSQSQVKELRRLGVPFFNLEPYLIRPSDSGSSFHSNDEDESADASDGSITEKQLFRLQKKMLAYLADLYGD